MPFGMLWGLPSVVLATFFHFAAAGWLAGTAAGNMPGAAAGGLAGATAGALAGAAAGLVLIDRGGRCIIFFGMCTHVVIYRYTH